MAKRTPGNERKRPASAEQGTITPSPAPSSFQLPGWTFYLFIFVFASGIYSNTLWNKYAIDDTIVLTDNRFTKKGLAGIKDHFTHDMFEGFFGERGAKLVSGGRYRPLSMVSLSVEYEISRKLKGDKRGEITDKNIIMGDSDEFLNPVLNHGVNILLFALTCVVLYYLLLHIIPRKYSLQTPIAEISLAFIATLLYTAHPLHTEAVANVKGRDEVMCMLFSLLALLAAVKYVKTDKVVHVIWGVLIYFVALLSKENSITFFAIIPLTFFFFTKARPKHYGVTLGLYALAAAAFLVLRSNFTQAGLRADSPEILNNPFVLATAEERYATTILTFLYYIKLMLIPHPLTHDYYFNQIPYVSMGDGMFLLSLLLNGGLLVYALVSFKRKSIASYAILFYFITFSIASNILFTVGVLMNERFIYMSSLGFCILLAYLLIQSKEKFKLPATAVSAVVVLILALYSYKTYSRNFDWKESFTLFRRDVMHSPNSAKVQTSVGGDLSKAADNSVEEMRKSGQIRAIFSDLSNNKYNKEELAAIEALPDTVIRRMILDSSISHLNEAIRIYPTHSNAWLLLGNSVYKRNHDPKEVIDIYEKAAAYRAGGYYDANYNLGIVYNEIKDPAMMQANAIRSKSNFLKAIELKPEAVESRFLLAQVYAKLNMPDSVAYWLRSAEALKAPTSGDYYAIGTNFGKVAGNLNEAIKYLSKAIEMNPKFELYYEDLGVAYGMSGRFDEAIATSQKLIELNPDYYPAYVNMAVSYNNKGNSKLAKEYEQKAREAQEKAANKKK